jgi:cytochrome c5
LKPVINGQAIVRALVLALILVKPVFGLADNGRVIYNTACRSCHEAGVAYAPMRGDKGVWADLMKKGMPALLASVKAGTPNMPAMGTCTRCTDAELVTAIRFMAHSE